MRWGLVNRAVPAEALDAEVAALAATIAGKSPAVVALGKRAFYRQVDETLAAAYASTGEAMACNLLEPDAAEGIDAFLGKRPPVLGRLTAGRRREERKGGGAALLPRSRRAAGTGHV